MAKKLNKWMKKLGVILEHVMAAVVIAAVVISIFSLWEPFCDFWNNRTGAEALTGFLERVLGIVIGIELFKMLWRPRIQSVLEVMMFCIARHMIVHETSSLENLLTVLGVAVLVIIQNYFLGPNRLGTHGRKKEKPEGSREDT